MGHRSTPALRTVLLITLLPFAFSSPLLPLSSLGFGGDTNDGISGDFSDSASLQGGSGNGLGFDASLGKSVHLGKGHQVQQQQQRPNIIIFDAPSTTIRPIIILPEPFRPAPPPPPPPPCAHPGPPPPPARPYHQQRPGPQGPPPRHYRTIEANQTKQNETVHLHARGIPEAHPGAVGHNNVITFGNVTKNVTVESHQQVQRPARGHLETEVPVVVDHIYITKVNETGAKHEHETAEEHLQHAERPARALLEAGHPNADHHPNVVIVVDHNNNFTKAANETGAKHEGAAEGHPQGQRPARALLEADHQNAMVVADHMNLTKAANETGAKHEAAEGHPQGQRPARAIREAGHPNADHHPNVVIVADHNINLTKAVNETGAKHETAAEGHPQGQKSARALPEAGHNADHPNAVVVDQVYVAKAVANDTTTERSVSPRLSGMANMYNRVFGGT